MIKLCALAAGVFPRIRLANDSTVSKPFHIKDILLEKPLQYSSTILCEWKYSARHRHCTTGNMNEAFENMFTEMENSEEMENPNIYCEKFKDDILNQIMALSETGLKSTEKLNLIGNLARLKHCKDCSLTKLAKTENQFVTTNSAPALAEAKNVGSTKRTTPTKEDIKTVITCPLCGKSLKSKSGLTRHLKSVHKDDYTEPGIKCPYCEKFCKNQRGLRTHQRYKHEDKILVTN